MNNDIWRIIFELSTFLFPTVLYYLICRIGKLTAFLEWCKSLPKKIYHFYDRLKEQLDGFEKWLFNSFSEKAITLGL